MLESSILDIDDDADAVSEKENFVKALHALGMVRSNGCILVQCVAVSRLPGTRHP